MWQKLNQAWQDPVKDSWWKVLLLIGVYLTSQILAVTGLIQYGLARSGLDSYDLVEKDVVKIIIVIVISRFLTMGSTGNVVQMMSGSRELSGFKL